MWNFYNSKIRQRAYLYNGASEGGRLIDGLALFINTAVKFQAAPPTLS
jgi:hypothetical protein